MTRVLVTGADGFIGSTLAEMLVRKGFAVRALCLYNSLGSLGWLDTIDKELLSEIEVVMGDVRDPVLTRDAIRGCEVVYHLAALIAIPYSYEAPSSYIETNINGTLNVLQAARDLDIRKVVHTSTSETYGTAQYVPIDESHPLVGQSPYSATKIGADQLAISFNKSFGVPITILRPFNTYGPRQSNRAVIPTIITQLAAGNKELVLGALSPTRDFNYVTDTCKAFVAVAESDKTIGKVINCASKFEVSIGETAKLIAELMGKQISIVEEAQRIRPNKSEVRRLYGDNSLIKELTDWVPEYEGLQGFKIGLQKTISWFCESNNLRMYKTDSYAK